MGACLTPETLFDKFIQIGMAIADRAAYFDRLQVIPFGTIPDRQGAG